MDIGRAWSALRDSAGNAHRKLAACAAACIGAACVGAAGCASLQAPHDLSPLPVPAAWTAAAASAPSAATTTEATPAAISAWWRQFGDATLDSLVARALDAATDVQAAEARLRQSRALLEGAAAALGPSVSVDASAQSTRAEGGRSSRLYKAGFDAGWEIDLWGGLRAGVSAAQADVAARQATLAQTRVALAAEVAARYVELRSAQARRAGTAAALASLEHTLRIAGWRLEAGLASRLDVEQQRTAVEQTRAQLPTLRTSVEQSMNALAVLAGAAPGELHATLAPERAVPEAPARLALAIPAVVLGQRADIAAAEAAVRAAAARVQQADAARLPSLQLSGSIGLNAAGIAALSGGAGVASVLAGVSLPAWDQGRRSAQVRVQEAALDEARAAHRAAVLAALQEVEDTLVALHGARAQGESRRAAAAAARRAAELAEQRYASGLTDMTTVLLAQRTRLAADDDVVTTAAALATQHVRLYKALGGGWTADDGPLASAAPAGR